MVSYPRYGFITGISNANQAVVTVSDIHDFTDGEIVSFRVTRPFGMVEMNNKSALVLSHDNTTITVDINSNFFTPFIYPAVETKVTPPVVVPSASGIIPGSNPETVTLYDSFDNRPPS